MSRIWKWAGVLFLGMLVAGVLSTCSGTTSTSALTTTISPSSTQSVTAGNSVSFSATASGGTAPYSYAWNFDSTNVGSGPSSATGSSATATFNTANTYVVKLTVTDATSATATATVNVTVSAGSGVTSASSLAGVWVTTCQPDTGGTNGSLTSRREVLNITSSGTYTGNYTDQEYQWHNNDHCGGSPQVFTQRTGTGTLYSATTSTAYGNATQMLLGTATESTTVYDSSVVTQYNSANSNAGAYGHSGWVKGTAVNTLGKNYDGTTRSTSQNTLIMVNGNVMFSSNYNVTGGSFPTTVRPTFIKVTNTAVTAAGIKGVNTSGDWVGNCHVQQDTTLNSTAYLERLTFSWATTTPVVTVYDFYYNQGNVNAATACDTTLTSAGGGGATLQVLEVQVFNLSFSSTSNILTDHGMATGTTATLYSDHVTPESSTAATNMNAANTGSGAYGMKGWNSGNSQSVKGFNEDGSTANTTQKISMIVSGRHFYVGGTDGGNGEPTDSSGYSLAIDNGYVAGNDASTPADFAGTWVQACVNKSGGGSYASTMTLNTAGTSVTNTEWDYPQTDCNGTATSSTTTFTTTAIGTTTVPRGTAYTGQLTPSGTTPAGNYCVVLLRTGDRLYTSPLFTPAAGSSGACNSATDFTANYNLTTGLMQANIGLETSPVTASTMPTGSWNEVCSQDSSGNYTRDYAQTFGNVSGLGLVVNDQTATYASTDTTCTGSVSSYADKTMVITPASTASNLTVGSDTAVKATDLDNKVYTYTNNGATETASTEKSLIKYFTRAFWVGDSSTATSTSYPRALDMTAPYIRIQ